jgi:hypothetical protein
MFYPYPGFRFLNDRKNSILCMIFYTILTIFYYSKVQDFEEIPIIFRTITKMLLHVFKSVTIFL